jgi:two-component system heavy metal sensor histidine kinase CusS
VRRFTPSLRLRLAFTTVAVLGAALGAFSLLLHATFSRALSRQFEDTLAADARAVANLAEASRDGSWEIEPDALEAMARSQGRTSFAIWALDGTLIARSPDVGDNDLPRVPELDHPVVRELRLPGGARALLYEALEPSGGEDGSSQLVTVAVARETGELDSVSALLWAMLVVSGLVTLALAALVATLAIRRGLAPLGALSSRLEQIDGARLDLRLPEEGLPQELRPVTRTLNQLLSRLEEAFGRERQFSADVSHELRTPLAGLRSILEVSAMRERPAPEYRRAISQALEVVQQMHGLVESLLLLARLEARQAAVESQEFRLRDFVDECFAPFEPRARARELQFENHVSEETIVASDREKLRVTLSNLLSNATEYTQAGGSISVTSDRTRGVLLEVEDSGPPIPEAALQRIFERFYRLDTSRAGTGEHCGIGLALVRSLCTVQGLSVWAENRPGGRVAFVVGTSERAQKERSQRY